MVAVGATILAFAGFLAVIEPYALDRDPEAQEAPPQAHAGEG
jgi:hypothetical protein